MKKIRNKMRVLLGTALVVALVIGSTLAAPSALATTIFLNTWGDTYPLPGSVGGTAIFEFFNKGDPTGSGVFDPFVRINANTDEEQGYNTSGRKLQFDENNSPTFTKDYELGAVPIVDVGGTLYREFQCDVNQNNKKGDDFYISLDQLEFYVTDTAGLLNYDFVGDATLKWQMNPGVDWIKINSLPNAGSGRRDFRVLIPAEDLAGGKFVILFSQFGSHYPNNGGYEEWGVRLGVTPPPPCIDVIKQIKVDDGDWLDADVAPQEGDENWGLVDAQIWYRIVVTNCGGVTLEDIQLTDIMYKDGVEIDPIYDLGSATYPDTLGPGEDFEIEIGPISACGCFFENIVTAVGVVSSGIYAGEYTDSDSAWFECYYAEWP